ncbi:arrestin domain-containing 2-like [Schistosoma japonicum]|uniref:Arrestin domain-containing 2-like n=1 Tax=Schistosoma japonicum TaxID=6182 RepID=A0A4Z2CVL0_SCHJA|nr:arrestin domain-containing 2-like [Schistosoma japonicum]
MGCENALSLKIEINIENELGVFEPRDEVAGHILIKTEEDTEIDSCILWLYGLAKTRWNTQSESYITRPSSLASGINLSRSTSNFNRFDNITSCIAENKFCKLLSNASGVIKHDNSSKVYENSSFRTQLNCCTDQGYLSDTHYRPSCNCNHSSYPFDRDLIRDTRIGESWISTSGSFNSSLDGESSIKSSHSFGKFHSPSMIITTNNKTNSNFTDYPLKTFQPISTTDKVYDSTCLPNFCLEQWKKLFEIDEEKKKCIYHGDLQLIYKSKNDLLKHYNNILSGKITEKIEHTTINNATETLKCDTGNDNDNSNNNNDNSLHKIHYINDVNYQQFNLKDQINKSTLSNNINKRYHDLSNTTNEKLQTSLDKSNKTKSKFILTRGIHVFYFEFQLPSDLPSSFELPTNCLAGGASASITYAVRIEICNNRLKLRHVQQREIIVFRPLELIHFPRLRDRITLHREFVSIGCCSHPSGLILCDLAVNKTGFVPGETIIPQVHITNKSSRAIQTVHLTFAQTVFLKGINDQSHVEVLRIFATRLNARSTLSGFDLFEKLEVNRISGLFSPSNSFSSRSSTNRFERIHHHQQKQQNSMKNKSDKRVMSNLKQKHHPSSTNVVAVASQGGKAYFTDLIHVPPLPTSGLLGRQRLIYVEYSLILRLRMQGDKEGKHDHCMQIPITIGSDPTRETSFTGNSEVIPCYASFNFASGDIVEYDPLNQLKSKRLTPVYRYFKSKPIESTANKSNITFSSDSPVNSNSVKSLQIISKSSPSILKQSSIISNSTNVTTHTTESNRQNSLKSTKSTCHDNEGFQRRQSTKQVNKSLVSSDIPYNTTTTSIPTLLHNLNETKISNNSYRKVQPRKCKSISTNKLKRQSNFQETTPQKVTTSNSIDVITIMNDSSQLCLSNQQYFDDGNITLRDTPKVIDNKVNSLKSLQRSKQTKSDSINLSHYEKAQVPASFVI